MHRSTSLFYLILLALLVISVPKESNSQPLLLKAVSKIRPETVQQTGTQGIPTDTFQPATDTPSIPPSLGTRNDISSVKKRVGRYVSMPSLPNISKQISSKCVMVMDAGSGETIYAKSPDVPRQPASTIKVLTGMIAMKSLKENELVNVSRKASRMPSSKIYLDPKKSYPADDLINAVLLSSANDASVALAERIAGDEKKFAHMMTLRAKFWGAKRTICKTASGLTAKGQQSTARDLANIFRHAMKNPEFAGRMKKRRAKTSYGQTLYNHNKALWRVKGTEGGKTGYTNAARQTYVGQFSRDGETIVIAILGSETMWNDVKNLVNYGFKKKQLDKFAREDQDSPSLATIN